MKPDVQMFEYCINKNYDYLVGKFHELTLVGIPYASNNFSLLLIHYF